MNYYNRNKKQTILPIKETLSVQVLYGQKSDARFEVRMPAKLKFIILQTAKSKDKSYADLTIRLWLDYLSKAGIVPGTLEKPSNQERFDDVEDFLNRNKKNKKVK